MVESTSSGPESILYVHQTGTTFGEVPLLANIPATSTLSAPPRPHAFCASTRPPSGDS